MCYTIYYYRYCQNIFNVKKIHLTYIYDNIQYYLHPIQDVDLSFVSLFHSKYPLFYIFKYILLSSLLIIHYYLRPIQDVHLFFLVCLTQDVHFLYLEIIISSLFSFKYSNIFFSLLTSLNISS